MITEFLSSLLFFIARLISFLPLSWLYGISRFIAFILRRVVNYRRNVIIQNLSRSFPDLKYKEINSLANKFYLHFTDVFIEVIKSISFSGNNLRKRFRVENPELLIKYYQENRNIIGLTGHVANWEWMTIIPSLFPFNCYTLYKPLKSKIAERIMTRIRHHFGMKLLPMSNAARFILSNKNSQSLYIFIGDQSPAKVENASEFIFLNQRTTFFTGGAKLARATGAAVVYISINRIKRGYYSVKFIPIEVNSFDNEVSQLESTIGTKQHKDIETQILSAYSSLLESDIIANPVDWLWSHKRWKH
ncbi:MAG: lysophospholipid acyltransferase family protein [Omnitrophica WOR_2 bacterium]